MKSIILGHRGYKAKYPENTLLSFQKALEGGADGIELDVHFTSDGEPVVFHDFELERMTDGNGMIFQSSYESIRKLRTKGNHQEKIPHLQEVIDLIKSLQTPGKGIWLNIEFKAGSDMYPGIEEKVLKASHTLPSEYVIYSSFDHYALSKIKGIHEKALTGALTMCSLYKPWDYLNAIGADFYHPHYLSLLEKPLRDMLEHRMRINTYTVNDITIAKQLSQAGVFSIITDDPISMKEAL